jgi:hypothetical protein
LAACLPVGGTEGVALLLIMVVEILSFFGLAALRALYNSDAQTSAAAGMMCASYQRLGMIQGARNVGLRKSSLIR